MSAPGHGRRAAWLAIGLSVGAAALAQGDGRSQIGSARAVERETALLQLGDAGLVEAADLQAVADRLADPVAAVRWNAIAALRKAGSTATPVLLARLADPRKSHHVGSYFGGCGRALFVPSEGELAAAVLAASPEADSDMLWHRFADADGDLSRLLGASLEAARRPPPAGLLRIAHRQPADRRALMLRLADAHDAQTIDALSAALDAAGNDRTLAFERGVAQVLARAGAAGRVAVAKALASSPYPEAWLALAAGREGDPAQAIRAFDAAALSGRPAALMAIAHVLAQLPGDGGDAPAAAPAWLTGVSPAAMRAFLAQPAGSSAADIERLARAAERVVPIAAWRSDVIALLARLLVAAERDATRLDDALGELAARLAKGISLAERQQAWTALRAPLGMPGARSAAFATVLTRLPPPPAADQPALARLLVAAVMAGRLTPTALRLPSADDDEGTAKSASPEDTAWRAALRQAVPGTAPGREAQRARLLAALGADTARVLQAWRAVEASPRATPAEAAEALAQLAAFDSTRAWASTRLMQRLLQSTDRAAASAYAAALWGSTFAHWSMSFDAEERQARARLLDGVWAQVSPLGAGTPARAAAVETVFTGTKYDMPATVWVTRAIAALGSSDARADAVVLAYLADAAPDLSAQTLSCDDRWRYASPMPRALPLDASTHARLASVLRTPLAAGGAAGDLALRVWRGFGLPSDAGIDARVAQAEARMAADCALPGSATTMADLQATLELPAGDATRARRFAEALHARTAAVACRAVASLGAMGGDAVPGAAALLRYWLGGTADRPHHMVHESATCGDDGPFSNAFAKGLGRLAAQHRGAVLQQALAADLPRPRAAGERVPQPPEHAQPTWAPLPDDAEAWNLERGERREGQRPVPAALLAALDDVLDAQLRARLDAAVPGPGWVLLAESHWLEATSTPRRGEPAPDLHPRPQARGVLPALAARWSALTAAQRARLMPLLGIADAADPTLRGMLDLSLENPMGGERAAALRVAGRLWPDDPRLPMLVRAEVVAQALAERLEPRLNGVFDALRRPRSICTSGSGRGGLPAFPWPPPAGYRTPEPLALDWFGPPGTTAGAWFDRVRRTLRELSSDYETGLFSGPPGGFALVARLERIDPTGKPFPGRARWTTEGQPKLNLAELLGDLFLERPGYFRIVVFVITDQPNFQPDPQARLPDVREGAAFMPPALAEMRLDGKALMALVYSFERRPGEPMRAWLDGSPSTVQHLMASGIWQRLNPRP